MKKILTSLCLFLLGFCLPPSFSQTQLGMDIDGEATLDRLGSSVVLSADGNRLAAGAPGNDAAGDRAGHVRVYEWLNDAWMQFGADIDGKAALDNSGYSVSLSSNGNRVAIGAPGNDGNGNLAGHVRVYEWMNGAWTQLGADIEGKAADDQAGVSVSLSADGNRVAIGAPFTYDFGAGHPAGKARVYEWMNGAWTQLGADIEGGDLSDEFGWSISLSSDGNRVAVGAPYPFSTASTSQPAGYVQVYEWANGAWTQLGEVINGEAQSDLFGGSVSLSTDGNRVAIGGKYNDGNGNLAGHVRVYEWTNGAWTQLGTDLDGEAAENHSGSSVSLSANGNRVAIGAPGNGGNGTNAGTVKIFEWKNEGWTQVDANIDGEAPSDESDGVSMTANGNLVAIGAAFNDGNGSLSGHVRVFQLTPYLSAVNSVGDLRFEIFPNPTNGHVYLTGLRAKTIKVFDGIGRLILQQNAEEQRIDLSNFPRGIYFLQVGLDGQFFSKTIIKE